MQLPNLPMLQSVAFKKLLAEDKVGADNTVSKSSGGLATFDKKKMTAGVCYLVFFFCVSNFLHMSHVKSSKTN